MKIELTTGNILLISLTAINIAIIRAASKRGDPLNRFLNSIVDDYQEETGHGNDKNVVRPVSKIGFDISA